MFCPVVAPSRPGKRFHVPELEESECPQPVRLFPRRKEIVSGNEADPQPAETASPGEVLQSCEFCLQRGCITSSAFKPQGRGDARITNHVKRRKDYKWYWRTLKVCGLWENSIYLERKEELGCLIDDVREVMPHCLVKDVRRRWPNPPHVPYQGHRRS